MRGDGGLGYQYQDTIHYFPHHRNGDGISDDEILEVSDSEGKRGYRSLETIHSYSSYCGFYNSGDNGRCE